MRAMLNWGSKLENTTLEMWKFMPIFSKYLIAKHQRVATIWIWILQNMLHIFYHLVTLERGIIFLKIFAEFHKRLKRWYFLIGAGFGGLSWFPTPEIFTASYHLHGNGQPDGILNISTTSNICTHSRLLALSPPRAGRRWVVLVTS